MATVSSAPGDVATTKHPSLKSKLETALPSGFQCTTRYIYTPSKSTEPLFSALPGQQPEKTFLTSHFLTLSFDPALLPYAANRSKLPKSPDVISFAIEVLIYTTKFLTTIFVSKVDSTPFIVRTKPSPIKTVVTTFLQWLADKERLKRPQRTLVISLFARAQAQYLFPGSADDKTKHVLDDRQLIRWWARVLDPILPSNDSSPSDDPDTKYQGYLTVPGYTGNELKSFMPPSIGNPARWLPGNPLNELARTRGISEHAPPRCLLPRFPDDPKARFMLELDEDIGLSQDAQVHVSPSKKKSGRWKSVHDQHSFWEQMEFRQECSSGRVVGFLWLVISPHNFDAAEGQLSESFSQGSDNSQSSLNASATLPKRISSSQPKRRPATRLRRRKALTGMIIPRQPRLKGGSSGLSARSKLDALETSGVGDGIAITKEGYDTAHQTLLNLDFSTLPFAIRSSSKWIAEVTSIAGLAADFGTKVNGTASLAAQHSSAPSVDATSAVNDIGGMIRKKRKAVDGDQGSEKISREPGVNLLGNGTIRKKAKPTT